MDLVFQLLMVLPALLKKLLQRGSGNLFQHLVDGGHRHLRSGVALPQKPHAVCFFFVYDICHLRFLWVPSYSSPEAAEISPFRSRDPHFLFSSFSGFRRRFQIRPHSQAYAFIMVRCSFPAMK